MEDKGREFKGMAAGANYKRFAKLFGMNDNFYKKCVGELDFNNPVKALDLGCGPGSLTTALCEKLPENSEVTGIDISEDQLNYAKAFSTNSRCTIKYTNMSMDELSFTDEYFDIVVSSMAFHETPPPIRRKAIMEASRVLKKGGLFLLADINKPRLGVLGVIWSPFMLLSKHQEDQRKNKYVELCNLSGLHQKEDYYINSLVRRQLFVKN